MTTRSTGTPKPRRVRKPVAGARALHRSNQLDARTVTRVSADGASIWLDILGTEAGPFSAENYTFTVRPEAASA